MKVQVKDIRLKRLPMEDVKKIVLIAGRPSHGYGSHEHNAGRLLLARLINENVPGATPPCIGTAGRLIRPP